MKLRKKGSQPLCSKNTSRLGGTKMKLGEQGIVAHNLNPSNQEAEPDRSL